MKQKMRKNCRKVNKSKVNEISKGKFKLKEQKSALENIKLLYKSRQAVIKLFNEYSSNASEPK